MKTLIAALVLGAALVSLVGCELSKSANPLDPAVDVDSAQPNAGAAGTRSLSGEEVVGRVMARYPDRLAGGISHAQRVANMEFLRDRVIEEGRCAGLKLAWNLKRSGAGPRSIDAITWRRGADNILEVVDIALDFDNPGRTLRLHWMIVDGPAWWDPAPEKTCSAA